MTFDQFYKAQAALLSRTIDHRPGMPAFFALVKMWNALAQIVPAVCDDVIISPMGKPDADERWLMETLQSAPNPFRKNQTAEPDIDTLAALIKDAIPVQENAHLDTLPSVSAHEELSDPLAGDNHNDSLDALPSVPLDENIPDPKTRPSVKRGGKDGSAGSSKAS